MSYPQVWLFVFAAALACLGFWFLFTRRISSPPLRILLRCLAAAWMLLPAPIPGYAGYYAPAFVVVIFEGMLKSEGEPTLALTILGAATGAVLLAVLLWYLFSGRKRAAGPQAVATGPSSAPAPPTVERSSV